MDEERREEKSLGDIPAEYRPAKTEELGAYVAAGCSASILSAFTALLFLALSDSVGIGLLVGCILFFVLFFYGGRRARQNLLLDAEERQRRAQQQDQQDQQDQERS